MSTPTAKMTPKFDIRSNSVSESQPVKISVRQLNFYYGRNQALHDISMNLPERMVTAFIGPSGCGKTTFLRTLNRMNDVIPGTRVEGEVLIDRENVYAGGADVVELRRKVGMVFQKSNPFPKSIFDNVAYGLRINRLTSTRAQLAERVEEALTNAALWSEVKDRLNSSALGLSGGQQQRLCIARALAIRPEVILMDEPASRSIRLRLQNRGIDLRSKEAVHHRNRHAQHAAAARVSDFTAFFLLGKLIRSKHH
jgi:phosphate transport system ATP-binding protein